MKSLLFPIITVIGWSLLSVGLSTSIGDWHHSQRILLGLVEHVNPGWSQWLSSEQLDTVNFILRKCAHFSEYAILFGLLYWLCRSRLKVIPKLALPLVLSSVILFAISDEVHQSFVPGRSPQARDVLIDSFGASVIALLCLKFDVPDLPPNNSSDTSR